MSKGKKYDQGKLRYSLIPPIALKALACVLTFGAIKYESNNWKKVEPFQERYIDALFRHIEAWRMGEKNDPESGLPHLYHALCNLTFLIWREENENNNN